MSDEKNLTLTGATTVNGQRKQKRDWLRYVKNVIDVKKHERKNGE